MKLDRIKPRWTLGGMMLLIALVAAPLAWYVHQAREAARQQRAAEAWRDIAVTRIRELLAEQSAKGQPMLLERLGAAPPQGPPPAVAPSEPPR